MSALVEGRTAVVTGASSGLGAEFAAQLAAHGMDLVLIARRDERLRELALRLERGTGRRVVVLARDLSEADAARALHADIVARGITVDLLINNAGFGTHDDVLDTEPAAFDEMIRLNITTLTGLSRRFAEDFVARRRGVIVNVASLAALLPAPHMAVYAATKAYVLSFTEALASELRGTGAAAMAVLPGPTRTGFFDRAGGSVGPSSAYSSASEVVAHTLRTLTKDRLPRTTVPGMANRASAPLIARLPRGLGLALSERMMR